MRILHTSDWHLGVSIEKASCEEEQNRFLDWLVTELRDRSTDALVVSGDVFHYPSPSNTAAEMYYDFLVDCAGLDTLRKVVIVAGNHDSPSGLEAPRRVLQRIDVEVVGRVPSDPAERDRCFVPVRNEAGEIGAVIVAVPFVRDARLGVMMGDDSPDERYRRYVRAFDELYRDLGRRARDRWPDTPLVATGHLTCYGADESAHSSDFDTEIHGAAGPGASSVGTIDPLSPSIFEEHYDYAALGHIHRPRRVADSVARYSGTPVPTKEAESPSLDPDQAPDRYVVDVVFDDSRSEPEVEWIDVPIWRRIARIEGTPEEVRSAVRDIDYDQPLPPYLYLEVELGPDDNPSETVHEVREILEDRFDESERPRIVDETFYDARRDDPTRDRNQMPALRDLEPVEVFEKKYEREMGDDSEPDEELLEAFRELQREVRETDRQGEPFDTPTE